MDSVLHSIAHSALLDSGLCILPVMDTLNLLDRFYINVQQLGYFLLHVDGFWPVLECFSQNCYGVRVNSVYFQRFPSFSMALSPCLHTNRKWQWALHYSVSLSMYYPRLNPYLGLLLKYCSKISRKAKLHQYSLKAILSSQVSQQVIFLMTRQTRLFPSQCNIATNYHKSQVALLFICLYLLVLR